MTVTVREKSVSKLYSQRLDYSISRLGHALSRNPTFSGVMEQLWPEVSPDAQITQTNLHLNLDHLSQCPVHRFSHSTAVAPHSVFLTRNKKFSFN